MSGSASNRLPIPLLVVALGAVSAAAGCQVPAISSPDYPCASDSDCRWGLVCDRQRTPPHCVSPDDLLGPADAGSPDGEGDGGPGDPGPADPAGDPGNAGKDGQGDGLNRTWQWAWSLGVPCMSSDGPHRMQIDSQGNLYVIGRIEPHLDLGEGNSPAALGGRDVFVASFTRSGEVRWLRRFGGSEHDGGTGLAVGPGDQIYLGGYFSGSADFADRNLVSQGGTDCFVARMDPGGTVLWSDRYGGPDDDACLAIAVDDSGRIYVSGYRDQSTESHTESAFVASWKADEEFYWEHICGPCEYDQEAYGTGICVRSGEQVVVTGDFSGTMDFGDGPVDSSNLDFFLLSLDPDGQRQWSKTFETSGGEYSEGIACQEDGNLLLAGVFGYRVTWKADATIVAYDDFDFFLAGLNASGEYRWAYPYGAFDTDWVHDLALGRDRLVYLCGDFEDNLAFGDEEYWAQSSRDAFLAAFDPAGQYIASRHFRGLGTDSIHAIAADADGRIYLAGKTSRLVDFGGPAPVGDEEPGQYTMFIVALQPSSQQ